MKSAAAPPQGWSVQRLLVVCAQLTDLSGCPVTSAMWSLSQAEVMLTLAVTDFQVFRAVISPLQCAQQMLGYSNCCKLESERAG